MNLPDDPESDALPSPSELLLLLAHLLLLLLMASSPSHATIVTLESNGLCCFIRHCQDGDSLLDFDF